MAKQAQALKLDTEAPASPVPEKPAVALIAEDPPPTPEPARKGRPPVAKPIRKPKPKVKAKLAPEILVLVETEEESSQYELEEVTTLDELLDVMDENRKVFVTRKWREF